MFHVGSDTKPLFNEILRLTQLQTCELQLSRIPFNLPELNLNLPISLSVRHFHLNTSISSASLCHLLQFMSSLRILNVHLYRHDLEGWHCLSSPQMTKRACQSFILRHIYLDDLVKSASNHIYLYTDIEPYTHSSYQILYTEYNSDNSKLNNVHLRMIWKKNPISHMLEIESPVIIQGQKCQEDKWIVGQYAHEYTIIKMYSVVFLCIYHFFYRCYDEFWNLFMLFQ